MAWYGVRGSREAEELSDNPTSDAKDESLQEKRGNLVR